MLTKKGRAKKREKDNNKLMNKTLHKLSQIIFNRSITFLLFNNHKINIPL